MKNLKFSIVGGMAFILAISLSAFSFTKENVQTFSLIENGIKTERTHWNVSSTDISCSDLFMLNVCQIKGDGDLNDNPTEESFADVLSGSNNFTQSYYGHVTYRP